MATSLEKLLKAERWRIKIGELRSSLEGDGWNGWFLVPLEGELWKVCISDRLGWKHLSVSNAQKKVLPSWNILSRLKDLFYGDDEYCVQFFPAKEDYVNDCEWCLHLWMSLDHPMPHPSVVLV